uniref:Protein LONGIFOLIA 1-like n=1 Tax=Rhizophora mucronata TaxID=61149 RepID=A0A2P2MLN1_RHIMU
MAAKLVGCLADDNPDLQKQIGCMTGIFQLFDRHHVLTSRRLSQRRLPPGDLHFGNGSPDTEAGNGYHGHTALETNLNKYLKEKHRISTESSRASFSSSCSSLSSVDYNKAALQDPSTVDRTAFAETTSRDTVISQPSMSPCLGRQSFDLQDAVKESMYREARGLPVKTMGKEEAMGHAMKLKDSPRPFQLSNPIDGSYRVGSNGKQNVPIKLEESLKGPAKFQEAPSYYNETSECLKSSYESKDKWHAISRDSSRFSCDGREINHFSLESQDKIKSTLKLKELPRLSLDSREISMQNANSGSKLDHPSKDLEKSGDSNEEVYDLWKIRPPSVVAKLMGLEALPDSASTSNSHLGLIRLNEGEQDDSFTRSLKENDLDRPTWIPKSPKRTLQEPVSPWCRNPGLVMKPISWLPIEPAPWKQLDNSRGSQKPAFKQPKTAAKAPSSFPSVYSEIEKRLKDLEFKRSGKDRRALRQILEATQSEGHLETAKEERGSKFEAPRDYEPKCTSPNNKLRLPSQQNQRNNLVIASRNRGSDSLRTHESPIVIMKPAKLMVKSELTPSSVIPIDSLPGLHKVTNRKGSLTNQNTKDQAPKSSQRDSSNNTSDRRTSVRSVKSTQSSMRYHQLPKESSASSAKSSGSVSPRLQQKKLELEKQSRPSTPPSYLSKPRRQLSRQARNIGSPGEKQRPKSPKLQPSDDQLSQKSNESRTSSHQGDDISLPFESNIIFNVKMDTEVTSTEQPALNCSGQNLSSEASSYLVSGSMQKRPTAKLEEDGTLTEIDLVAPEHPSPVSVLDSSLCRDDVLSPVKQTPIVSTDDGAQDSKNQHSEEMCSPAANLLSDSTGGCGLTSEIDRKKLQRIENLVQKLRRLNSTHDEASTDYIASLCENTNPDHRYISEILLASGLLLRDLSSGLTTLQLHPSGHPINPELFFVLEQTKASTLPSKEECNLGKSAPSKKNLEKFHRQLQFDAVNEILLKKFTLPWPSLEPWLKSEKLAKKTLSAQKLLKEMCLEIDQLQARLEDEEDCLRGVLWDDVMRCSESWTDFQGENYGVALDVERLIFKDLVDEIVIAKVAALCSTKPGMRRQLFAR